MYGIGSWDGLCLTVLEHTCSLMQRKNLCWLVWWNSQDFSCEKLLFHPQSRVQNHICVWSLCPRVSTKKWHQDAAKGSCKKTLIISKGLVNFTLKINLPFEKMSFIWTQHQFHWRPSISMPLLGSYGIMIKEVSLSSQSCWNTWPPSLFLQYFASIGHLTHDKQGNPYLDLHWSNQWNHRIVYRQ